jgi:uncharacterized membrane protein
MLADTKDMNKYTAGRGLGIMLLITGTGHFLAPASLDKIIPPALPLDPRFWTYLSGVAELVVALMLLSPMTAKLFGKPIRQLGVWCAFALFVLVFPANIYMAIVYMDHAMPDPLIALVRLPLQFGLFYWCWALNKDMNKELAKAN